VKRPALLGLLVACSTSETPRAAADAAAPAAQVDADAAAPETACSVGPVPASVRTGFALDPFYEKHTSVGALPIVASRKVPDAALCAARDVVTKMLAFRPELAGRLAEKKIRLALMAESELTTDIPEHSDLTPKDYWDQRARGLGATLERPAVSAAEENVLCYASDRYRGESILVHEFGHAVFDMAIDLYQPTMGPRLQAAYDAAMKAGRFAKTYAAENPKEYWAEGVQDWFDTNLSATPPDGIHNEIHTRAQLLAYDPDLAAIVRDVFGDAAWRYACPSK
jgi:hypothetical protein